MLRPKVNDGGATETIASEGKPRGGGIFNVFRDRRERREDHRQNEGDVRYAVGLITGFDNESEDEIVKSIDSPELMRKASELIRLIDDASGRDEEYLRNIARGLKVDGESHQVLNAMYAHREYLAEDPRRIGPAVAMVVHMANQRSLFQLADGTVPHLDGYVETLNDVAHEGREGQRGNVTITTTDASIAFSRHNRSRKQNV